MTWADRLAAIILVVSCWCLYFACWWHKRVFDVWPWELPDEEG